MRGSAQGCVLLSMCIGLTLTAGGCARGRWGGDANVEEELRKEVQQLQKDVQIAYLHPLWEFIEEGDYQRVRLEVPEDGEELITVESQQRELLEEIRRGLETSERDKCPAGWMAGCPREALAIIYGERCCVRIEMTCLGFTVCGACDYCTFVSPILANALDRLFFAQTSRHFHQGLIEACSGQEEQGFAARERVWKPAEQEKPCRAEDQFGVSSDGDWLKGEQ